MLARAGPLAARNVLDAICEGGAGFGGSRSAMYLGLESNLTGFGRVGGCGSDCDSSEEMLHRRGEVATCLGGEATCLGGGDAYSLGGGGVISRGGEGESSGVG